MASKEQRQAAIKKAAKTVRAGQTGFVRRASDSPPSGPAETVTCCPYAIFYGLTKCPYHPRGEAPLGISQ